LSAVRCAYVFMFCSHFFSLCSPLFMLLLSFICYFFPFSCDFCFVTAMWIFSRWLSAVALPCFWPFAVVAVAARLNVFMARISANMQSDHNLLNVFFAGGGVWVWGSPTIIIIVKKSAHCEWSNAVCHIPANEHTRAALIYGQKQRTRHINRN